MPTNDPPHQGLDPVAGFLALLIPGAGQFYRREIYRGVMACVGVLGLFFGGMFVGGIDVIDSREDRIWFVGQAFVGPIAFGVDYVHQNHFKAWADGDRAREDVLRTGHPDEKRVWNDSSGRYEWRTLSAEEIGAGQGPPNVKSVAKMNEVGTLAATLAGMLNFIILLDALMPGKRSAPGREGRAS